MGAWNWIGDCGKIAPSSQLGRKLRSSCLHAVAQVYYGTYSGLNHPGKIYGLAKSGAGLTKDDRGLIIEVNKVIEVDRRSPASKLGTIRWDDRRIVPKATMDLKGVDDFSLGGRGGKLLALGMLGLSILLFVRRRS